LGSAQLIEIGGEMCVLSVGVDITDKKNAEEALRASEERLRSAQWAARIGTFEWDFRTGVVTLTPEMEALHGLPQGRFDQTKKAFENLVHPDDRERVTKLGQLSLETGQPTEGEYRVVWPDGSVHWIAGRGQVIMSESGEPLRMVGVNMDVTERKLAEDKLREYERAVEGSEDLIAVVDREYRYVIANSKFASIRNMTKEQVVGHLIPEVLNKGVFETIVKPKLDECFQGHVVRFEMKYTYPQIGERDMLASYFPIEGANGIDRVACIWQDITERKRAEEALSGMTRKLIEAQEQERALIARELHDDINQRLAMLAIELEQLHDNPSEVRSRLQELRKQTIEISNDVHAVSHDLHSSQLEYLGVVAGMKSWCKEFGARQGIEIDCKHDLRSTLPSEIGLCLFRVLQEALHNAAKHSGLKRIEAQLYEDSGEIHLVVSDSGRGFDVEAAKQGEGLGLTSMRERVRLMNGKITIDSKPMGGTRIHVRVPLESEHASRQLAG
jgi:PAS domain S-box-containing protein